MFFQQGDVILEKVNLIPKGTKKKKRTPRGYILAEGEVTGHAHVIEQEIEFYEKAPLTGRPQLFVKNKQPVKIKHEEHKTFTLPIGNWEVKRVREYDHFKEESRRVED